MKRLLLMTCAVVACFVTSSAQGQVKSSVFDDVKVWYKGSAGNAVGTSDNGLTTTKLKSLPQLSTPASAQHGGTYNWWGWRIQYQNQEVECPYAGCTLASTPCMVIPQAVRRVVGSDTDFTTDPSGYVDVDVGGVVTSQPYYSGMRFGALYIDSWLSDWDSGTVCSNYTIVLRFKSDVINPVSGNPNRILQLGNSWDATPGKATGVAFMLNTPNPENGALKDYAYPRFFVGQVQKNYDTQCPIKHGRWVDCAIVVDENKLTSWFCWNCGTEETPTNKLVKITETYSGGWPTVAARSRLYLASSAGVSTLSWTNGVYSTALNSSGAFKGTFHQIAFWERTLSDDEVREAMAGGTGRPDLVHVGLEGNGTNEFTTTSSQTASVSNTGAWENLIPTLTGANPTATISFTCPALLTGRPQFLRVPLAAISTAGTLSVGLNGETLGTVAVSPDKVARFYVPENKIVSGANTLVLTRTGGGTLVLDAITMGGSWRFGNTMSSFSDSRDGNEIEVRTSPDRYLFNPACGSDKLHDRSLTSDASGTQFHFYVPEDLVGRYRGQFITYVQNTSGSKFDFEFLVNGTSLGTYQLQGGGGKGVLPTDVEVPETAIVAGWNTFAWKRVSGWANIDCHIFTLTPPPQGMALFIR